MNNGLNGNWLTPGRNHGTRRTDIHVQIMDVLQRGGTYDMEELVRVCPSFSWNQVFLEVDRLSRTGELRLVPRRAGVYAVTLPGSSSAEGGRPRSDS